LNEEGVQAGDAEAVHQMRVGLRRLRAAMSIFKRLVDDPESEHIKAELEWLTEELGPARDFDVFVNETPALDCEARLHAEELGHLSTVLGERRAEGFERAAEAVRSHRYRRLVLDTALWLTGGAWATTDDELVRARRELPVRPFARRVLKRRTRKIDKRLRKLAVLDERARHKLRISVKKLRYATEFFASLFPAGNSERKAFVKALKELQDALGNLNDAVVHDRVAREITAADPNRRHAPDREATFAIGLVRGREDADGDDLLSRAAKARTRLHGARPFWQ
jgi:CHAD domain-containing protein